MLVEIDKFNRKDFKLREYNLIMEKQNSNITREELEEFMRQIEGIKSTIEILQNKELMKEIKESEELERKGADFLKLEI